MSSYLPGLGLLLVGVEVLVFQGGSVVAKSLPTDPLVMLLLRDVLQLSQQLPPALWVGHHPFPAGRRLLLLLRGVTYGICFIGHFYAIRYLPIADVAMITSIKPVVITLLSCIFLKEPCGLFEIGNLALVISGIFLVVQPPFFFGPSGQEYSTHMFYTSMALLTTQCLAAVTTIVVRYLRDMHWATLAISTRLLNIVEVVAILSYRGLFCLPTCGLERLGILILAGLGCVQQVANILSLKLEEAHVVGLVQNSLDILVSFIFQVAFFKDYPGHWKLLGAGLILASVVSVGVNKVKKAKKLIQLKKQVLPSDTHTSLYSVLCLN